MRLQIRLLSFLFISAGLLASCQKDDDDFVQPVRLDVTLSIDSEDSEGLDIPLSGTEVKLTNQTNGQTYTATADENGNLVFESILPGTYSVNASLLISAVTFTEISGIQTAEDVAFNTSLDGQQIVVDQSLELMLQAGKIGDWVFKQLYYAGSHTQQGASFRDVFVEIYNNSNQILYADSLYFGQVYGKNNNNTGDYLQDNLQYDWNQSLSHTGGGDANNDYVFMRSLFMVPSDGSGTKYPVDPGESIIIAASALNHTVPYQRADGDPVEVVNPMLTIDLSQAEFEVYMAPYELNVENRPKPYVWDFDNPGVDKVEVLFKDGMRDFVTNALGREAFVIVSVSGTDEDPRTWPRYADPSERELLAETTRYPRVPAAFVLDAVEMQHPVSSSRVPKRVPNRLDAGRAFVPGGQYSSQSLVRKTKRVLDDGRRVLQDTNNSEADFGYLEKADPSKGPASFDAITF